MKALLICALLLAGCASHRLQPSSQPAAYNLVKPIAEPIALPAAPAVHLDSVVLRPHRSLFDKARAAVGFAPAPAAQFGRIGKKATVNFYYAPATIIGAKATATIGDGARTIVAGKKATQATDSATQQVATNAVAGHGNSATQTATTKQAADWKARLAGPLGWVLALAVVGAGVYFLGPLLIRRRV